MDKGQVHIIGTLRFLMYYTHNQNSLATLQHAAWKEKTQLQRLFKLCRTNVKQERQFDTVIQSMICQASFTRWSNVGFSSGKHAGMFGGERGMAWYIYLTIVIQCWWQRLLFIMVKGQTNPARKLFVILPPLTHKYYQYLPVYILPIKWI